MGNNISKIVKKIIETEDWNDVITGINLLHYKKILKNNMPLRNVALVLFSISILVFFIFASLVNVLNISSAWNISITVSSSLLMIVFLCMMLLIKPIRMKYKCDQKFIEHLGLSVEGYCQIIEECLCIAKAIPMQKLAKRIIVQKLDIFMAEGGGQ